jgi:hypothetical protein
VHTTIDDEDSDEDAQSTSDDRVSTMPNSRGVVKHDADTSMKSDDDDNVPTISVKQV